MLIFWCCNRFWHRMAFVEDFRLYSGYPGALARLAWSIMGTVPFVDLTTTSHPKPQNHQPKSQRWRTKQQIRQLSAECWKRNLLLPFQKLTKPLFICNWLSSRHRSCSSSPRRSMDRRQQLLHWDHLLCNSRCRLLSSRTKFKANSKRREWILGKLSRHLSTPTNLQSSSRRALPKLLARKTGKLIYVGNSISFASAGMGGTIEERWKALRRSWRLWWTRFERWTDPNISMKLNWGLLEQQSWIWRIRPIEPHLMDTRWAILRTSKFWRCSDTVHGTIWFIGSEH